MITNEPTFLECLPIFAVLAVAFAAFTLFMHWYSKPEDK